MADIRTVMDSDTVINLSDSSMYHDRVLIVGDEKFYVLSQVLSLWSEYFRAMFDGNFIESNKKEIELKEVDANIFKLYLENLYRNFCDLKADDLIPLINLSFRFLTPHVLEYCKSFIDINFDELDSIKVELLRTSCHYDIKFLKNKMIEDLQKKRVLRKLNLSEIVNIVVEYNLEELKTRLTRYARTDITTANCIDLLESSVKLNMPILKEKIIDFFKNESVMAEFKLGAVVDIVIDYNLEHLKTWLGTYLSKNVTIENCVDRLEASFKLNRPILKKYIIKIIGMWSSFNESVPRDQFLELTKAAFKYDIQKLKDLLCHNIKQYFAEDRMLHRRNFFEQNYNEIRALPEDIRDFIVRSVSRRT